jgi:hypothetical protein
MQQQAQQQAQSQLLSPRRATLGTADVTKYAIGQKFKGNGVVVQITPSRDKTSSGIIIVEFKEAGSRLDDDEYTAEILHAFYSRVDPSKVANIPQMLSRFTAEHMRGVMMSKYGEAPEVHAEGALPPLDDDAYTAEILHEFYARVDPSKVANIPQMLSRFTAEFMRGVMIVKYGESPEPRAEILSRSSQSCQPGERTEASNSSGAALRSFFDTADSAQMRASDPNGLVGKVIQVKGETGTVTHVVSKVGSSTLHTVTFDSGRVENVRLAKRRGGKGVAFYVAEEEETHKMGPAAAAAPVPPPAPAPVPVPLVSAWPSVPVPSVSPAPPVSVPPVPLPPVPVPPPVPPLTTAAQLQVESAGHAADLQLPPLDDSAYTAEILHEFYSRMDPTKVDNIPLMLQRFSAGFMRTVMLRKYGESPDIPSTPCLVSPSDDTLPSSLLELAEQTPAAVTGQVGTTKALALPYSQLEAATAGFDEKANIGGGGKLHCLQRGLG